MKSQLEDNAALAAGQSWPDVVVLLGPFLREPRKHLVDDLTIGAPGMAFVHKKWRLFTAAHALQRVCSFRKASKTYGLEGHGGGGLQQFA